MKRILLLASACFACTSQVTFAQCSVDLGADTVTVYFGYQPLACTTLSPAVVGEAPLTFIWSNGATTPEVTACDEADTWYHVAVTDAGGCTVSDSVFVRVVDVRCGNNNNKVLVCHIPPGNPANAHTICISANGVPARLAHGCQLGECATSGGGGGGGVGGTLEMLVSPNPTDQAAMVTIISTSDQQVELDLFDSAGRRMMELYRGAMTAGERRSIPLEGSAAGTTSHLVWLHLRGSSGSRVQQALMLER